MDLSSINGGLMSSLMVQMKNSIDLKMKDLVNQANTESGNPLGESVEFSKPSELLAKLSQLKNEDPEKFKELMNDISELLKKASEEAGAESQESKFLAMMSEKFASAAESGDLSEIQPPKPPVNPGTDQAKFAQYESSSSTGDDQETLLSLLIANLGSADKTDASSFDLTDTMAEIQKLISEALQNSSETKV